MSIGESLTAEKAAEEAVDPVLEQSEQEEVQTYQFGISHSSIANSWAYQGKSRKLYCFSCHRQESHYSTLKGRSHRYLLIGMTFGLILLFGPYRCRCCGHKRLCSSNLLNLRYHLHRRKYTRDSRSSSSVVIGRNLHKSSKKSSPQGNLDAKSTADDIPEKRRRRRRKLKSVPVVESIGKNRREQLDSEIAEQLSGDHIRFTMDGLLSSFETEQSRRAKAAAIRASKTEFVGKRATTRNKVSRRPRRRHVRKVRLTGPKIYCFSCKQNLEHYHHFKTSSYYTFICGITLGLIMLVGPYRCSVCSHTRLFGLNLLHPKFYIRRLLEQFGEGYGS